VALSPALLLLARGIYVSLGGQMVLGASGATAARLLLSALVLGVPTFLMGGTLPALSKAVTTADDPHRRRVAILYGLNTLGAVAGAAVCTFVLLEHLGTRFTLWVACAINFAEGTAAWGLAKLAGEHGASDPLEAAADTPAPKARNRKSRRKSKRDDPPAPKPGTTPSTTAANLPASAFYAASALVGFTFFLMELVWFRMLAPVLGGTTFTFGLILVVALLGIGLGGAMYNVFYRDRRPTLLSFGLTCALEAALIALPYALGDHLAVLAIVLRDLGLFGFYGLASGWFVIAGIVILPAAFVAGVQFPVLVALVGQGVENVGKQVGLTFAWNTVGAILGSLFGGFGALPILSATGSWMMVVMLLVLLGAAVIVYSLRAESRAPQVAFPVALLAAALLCTQARGPTAVWRHGSIGAGRAYLESRTRMGLQKWEHQMRSGVLAEADGVEASVAFIAHDGLSFFVNGKSDGGAIGDADSFIMPGLIGAMLHPNPETALVVGLGTGETAGWMAEVDSIDRVDVVELEPVVTEIARLCAPINFDVLRHEDVNLYINDAREVLLTFPEKYDLVVSQPSNPYRAGVAGLFTREYYAGVKQRMNEGGLFLQWMQAYEIDADTVGTVFATLDSEFEYIEVWQTNALDMLFVCSMEPLEYAAADLRAKIKQHPFDRALRVTWNVDDLEGVFARFVAGYDLVKDVSREGPRVGDGVMSEMEELFSETTGEPPRINTDDRNYLEYGSARLVGKQTGFSIMHLRELAASLRAHRPPLLGALDWEAVKDQRVTAGFKDKIFPLRYDDPARRLRAVAITKYLADNLPEVVQAWESQPREPRYAVEFAVLAHAYAMIGEEEKAPSLIERLEAINPLDAEAMRAVVHHRNGDYEAAAESIETVFLGLREDPWAEFVQHTFSLALNVIRKDPSQAQRIYEAMSAPFSVYRYESLRRQSLWRVATALGPRVAADCIATYEPWVPWTEKFLQNRALMYYSAGHPLLPRAMEDLKRFRSQKTSVALMNVQTKQPPVVEPDTVEE